MPEQEIPPPSGTLEYYRAEVGRRAGVLGRRHRRRVAGATATVVVLALVALVTTVRVTAPSGHVSATGASSAGAPTTVPGSLRHQPTGSANGPGANGPGANGAGANGPSPSEGSGSGSTGTSAGVDEPQAPQYSNGVPPHQVTVYEQPSGTVVSAAVHQNVLVVLAPTSGGWGRAVIGRGRGTVLTLVSQTDAGHAEELQFRTRAVGTATVAVPPAGKPAAPWRLTVVVKGS